ncbi:MAG: UDP-forming cellulose synthase catalytic subunit [Pseudomonadota bacterium]
MIILKILSWGVIAALMIVILAIPVSLTAQLSLAVVTLIVLLATYLVGPRLLSRQLFIAAASAVIVKYLIWRATSTLPPFDNPIEYAAAYILFAAEVYSIAMLYFTMFVIIDPLERPTVTMEEHDPAAPTVDVFVPTYDESVDLVAHTLAAAKAMLYGQEKLTVWLLDDGGTQDKINQDDFPAREAARERKANLMELCNQLGVRYLSRAHNEMAKAGNLNHGLAHAKGDLVVVLDADHAPKQEFLLRTVGHFHEDPDLFLVQTPHAFLNDDPIERNLALPRTMPAEHQMFYKSLQKGLDSWNASYFCGSAAVLRRKALDEVGGFAGVSITEDCESALELHARGWSSRFVDERLIWGLQPETFTSLMKQRARWCSGMLQILLLKNPLLKPGLTMAQRLSYMTACLYWLFPMVRWIFVFAPLMYIFFDMEIFMASTSEFLVYTAPYMVAVVLLQAFFYGRYRWPWMSEIYEYVQSIHLVKSVLGTFIAPRKPTFNVTPKGFVLDEEKLSSMAAPYFLIFFVLVAALITALWRIASGDTNSLLYIVTGWNLFNLIIAGMALGAVCDRRELRYAPRLHVGRHVAVTIDGQSATGVVADVSHRGLRVDVSEGTLPLTPGNKATISVPAGEGRQLSTQVTVRRRSDGSMGFGASFDLLDEFRFGAVAELMCGRGTEAVADRALADQTQRQAEQQGGGLIFWTAEFLLFAVKETMRGLAFGIGGKRERQHPPTRTAPELQLRLRRAVEMTKPQVVGLAAVALLGLAAIIFTPAFARGEALSATAIAAPDVAEPALRRLPASQNDLFLQGEDAKKTVVVHLSADEVNAARALRVTAGTSVTALLEDTSVDAFINGELIGRVLSNALGPRETRLSVPAGLLRPGWNAVTFTARHQHRFACDLDSTYSLWTEIDPAQTGFELAAPMAAAHNIMSVAAATAAPTTLHVHHDRFSGPNDVAEAIRIANALTLMTGAERPVVKSATTGSTEPGVHVVKAVSGKGWVAIGKHLVAQPKGDHALVALRPGSTIADLEADAAAPPLSGHTAGIAARTRQLGAPLTLGATYAFADLGSAERIFMGRRFTETLPINLPTDMARTGQERVTVTLKGEYTSRLTDEAALTIKVNGAEVHSMPLDGTPETTLNHKPFVIPLTPFHRGRNLLTIEANLSTADDAACAPGAAAVKRGRFLLSETSTITLPTTGRAGIAPDLAAFYWGALPYADQTGDVPLLIADRGESVTTAAALMAAVTANAQELLPLTVTFDESDQVSDSNAIVVGSRATLSEADVARFNERPERAWVDILSSPALATAAPQLSKPAVELVQRATRSGDPLLPSLLDNSAPLAVTVVASNAAPMAAAVQGARDVIPFDPRGAHFSYSGEADQAVIATKDAVLFATQPPRLGNLRLVLGKWMSGNADRYVTAIVVLTLVLGVVLAASARSRSRNV